MKQGIILLAHGSRYSESQNEFKKLVQSLEKELELPIKDANLEFIAPDFFSALDDLISLEVAEVIVIPLFIFAGKHVKKDLKQLIARGKVKYPELEFQILSHLAGGNDLSDLLLQRLFKELKVK